MGRTPLHRAAGSNGNPAVIEVLLAAGADPKKRDNNKETPLHSAANCQRKSGGDRSAAGGGCGP